MIRGSFDINEKIKAYVHLPSVSILKEKRKIKIVIINVENIEVLLPKP